VPVDPGSHRVEAHGTRSYDVTVQVSTNGVIARVTIPSLVPPAAPVAWQPAPTWKRDVGAGLVGVGASAFALGAVLGLQAIVQVRDVRAQCGDASTCPNAAAVHQHDLGGTDADWSTALIPVGLVAAAAGVFVLTTAHGSFEPVVGPGQARLNGRWTW